MTQDVKWAGQVDADDSDMFCDDCGLPENAQRANGFSRWVNAPRCYTGFDLV